jgi:putative membrane protein
MSMGIVAALLIIVVAALHCYFLVLEMFLWKTPYGRRVFGLAADTAETTATLAANQGLYNGFLAAGLIWALGWYGLAGGRPALTFFLACVVAAGIFGGVTASRRILVAQALPGALALAALWAL